MGDKGDEHGDDEGKDKAVFSIQKTQIEPYPKETPPSIVRFSLQRGECMATVQLSLNHDNTVQ